MAIVMAARVKAANQFNRKYKMAKEAGMSGDEAWAAAGGGASRRNTKLSADEKAADNHGAPIVVVETEVERMRRERREKKDRLNLSEVWAAITSQHHSDSNSPAPSPPAPAVLF